MLPRVRRQLLRSRLVLALVAIWACVMIGTVLNVTTLSGPPPAAGPIPDSAVPLEHLVPPRAARVRKQRLDLLPPVPFRDFGDARRLGRDGGVADPVPRALAAVVDGTSNSPAPSQAPQPPPAAALAGPRPGDDAGPRRHHKRPSRHHVQDARDMDGMPEPPGLTKADGTLLRAAIAPPPPPHERQKHHPRQEEEEVHLRQAEQRRSRRADAKGARFGRHKPVGRLPWRSAAGAAAFVDVVPLHVHWMAAVYRCVCCQRPSPFCRIGTPDFVVLSLSKIPF